MTAVGSNAKMDEFRAAMGVCNLRHIEESIASRGEAVARYRERLGNVPGIRFCAPQPDVQTNYAYFPVYFNEAVFGKTRDDVMEALKAQDIFTRKYFYPAINEMAAYQDVRTEGTPVAHNASVRILTLPLYEGLGKEDIDQICDIVKGL